MAQAAVSTRKTVWHRQDGLKKKPFGGQKSASSSQPERQEMMCQKADTGSKPMVFDFSGIAG